MKILIHYFGEALSRREKISLENKHPKPKGIQLGMRYNKSFVPVNIAFLSDLGVAVLRFSINITPLTRFRTIRILLHLPYHHHYVVPLQINLRGCVV
jgi:hypothetical protein